MTPKRGLGRGLNALIGGQAEAAQASPPAPSPGAPAATQRTPIDRIRKNPWQPRHDFAEEALDDLVQSIKTHGVLQPLLVRKVDDHFELIAGERRLRAATRAELRDVPIVVVEAGDQAALELALIENLQREDLNIIEEAEGYRLLADKFGLTQEEVAERVGKARATVTNALRILSLPAEVKQRLSENELGMGHARALVGLSSADEQRQLAKRIVDQGLSVREVEKLIAAMRTPPAKPPAPPNSDAGGDVQANHLRFLSDILQRHYGTRVHVSPCVGPEGGRAKGTVSLEYYSSEDLMRILDVMGVSESI